MMEEKDPTTTEYLYFRVQDSDTLFLLKRSVFAEPGTVPEHSVLRYAFGGAMEHSKPIFWRDGIPVFALAVPASIMKKMLHFINLPHLKEQMEFENAHEASKEVARAYGEYFGFAPQTQTLEDYKNLARAWLAKEKNKIEDDRLLLLLEVCKALVNTIYDSCPTFAFLRDGKLSTAHMEFVSSFGVGVKDYTFKVLYVSHNGKLETPVARFLVLMSERFGPGLIPQMIAEAFDYNYVVNYTSSKKEDRLNTAYIHTKNWPTGVVSLDAAHYQVVTMRIQKYSFANRDWLQYLNE